MCKKKIETDYEYPYLGGIGYQGELVIFVDEGIVSPEEREVEITEGKSISGNPIEVTSKSRRIEIRFEEVFSYHVMDESYGALPEYEKTINQLRNEMHANEDVLHYEIVTEDVIINVVAYSEPRIAEQKREST